MAAAVEAFPEPDERIDLRRLLIVFSVMLAVLLEIIDTSIVNTALPSMMGNLGATLDEIDWVITGYIISNVIVIPLTGWFAARFGRKRYFTVSILVFTSASLMCGLSPTVNALVFWRVVQGLGGGALLATSQAIMVETFPARQQGTGQAIFGFGAMIGPSLGPTLGGWITDNYSWHWIFLINVPLGLLAAFLCASVLRDPDYLKARRGLGVDWPGIALLVAAVGCLQTVLERGHKDDWFESPMIFWMTVVAGFAGALFVVRELTAEHPVVDLRVLRRRPLAVGCALGVLMGVGLYGSIFLFPVYTQQLLRWTAWDSGLAVLPSSLTTAVMMVLCGRLIWRVGPRVMLTLGMCVMICGLWKMSQWTLDSGWDQLFWPQVMRGLAMGLMFVPVSVATLRALPPTEVAQGAGLYNLFRQLGGSFGVAVLTTVLDRRADVHRFPLSETVGPLDPNAALQMHALTRLLAHRGLPGGAAERAAAALLDAQVSAHAHLAAFQDAYLMIAALFVLGLPLLLLVAREAPGKAEERARAAAAAASAHEAVPPEALPVGAGS
jgi:DHA2 family multidrug resistance protein